MKSLIPLIIVAAALLTYSIYIQPPMDTDPPSATASSPKAPKAPQTAKENIADYPLSMESGYKYPLLLEGGYWEPCGAGECD